MRALFVIFVVKRVFIFVVVVVAVIITMLVARIASIRNMPLRIEVGRWRRGGVELRAILRHVVVVVVPGVFFGLLQR